MVSYSSELDTVKIRGFGGRIHRACRVSMKERGRSEYETSGDRVKRERGRQREVGERIPCASERSRRPTAAYKRNRNCPRGVETRMWEGGGGRGGGKAGFDNNRFLIAF